MDGVVSNLAAAARVSLTSLNNAERAAAEQYIAEAKASHTTSLVPVGFMFVESSQSDAVLQHFGFHLLEYCIETHWNDFAPDAVAVWKERLVGLLSLSPLSGVAMQKIAVLISRVALREWPQHWPDLLPSVVAQWKDESRRELVLRVLLTLCQEGVSNLSMPKAGQDRTASCQGESRWDTVAVETRRKREVVAGVRENLPGILQLVLTALSNDLPAYLQLPPSCFDGRSNPLTRQVDTCMEIMEVAAELATTNTWIELNALDCWVQCLSHPMLCKPVAEVLHCVLSQSTLLSKCSHIETLVSFVSTLMKYIAGVVSSNVATMQDFDRDEEQVTTTHSFAIRLAEVGDAVVHNAELLRELAKHKEGLVPVDSATICLLQHPSASLHLHGLLMLKHLIPQVGKRDGEVAKGRGESFYAEVLRLIHTTHLIRPLMFDGSTPSVSTRYSEVDFGDSEDEFLLAHTSIISNTREITLRCVHYSPAVCISRSAQAVRKVLQLHTNGASDDVLTAEWSVLEASLSMQYDCFRKLEITVPRDLPCMAELSEAGCELLRFEVPDASLITKYLMCTETVVVFLLRQGCAPSSMLEAMLSMLIKMMDLRPAGESVPEQQIKTGEAGGWLSPETVSVRRRVHVTLLHICDAMPSQVLPFLPHLVAAWTQYQADSRLTAQESSMFTESLSVLTMQLPPQQKILEVDKIIGPVLGQAVHCLAAASSAEAFRRLAEGLLAPLGSAPDLELARVQLKKCISILCGVYKRGAGSAEKARELLFPLVQLISSMHAAWVPGVLSPSAQALLKITPEEQEQSMGGTVVREVQHLNQQLTHAQTVYTARQYIGQLRSSSYSLLGGLCNFDDIYSNYDKIFPALFNPSLQHLELLSLKYFFTDLCLPFLLLMKPQYYPTVLTSFFPAMCRFMYDRISAGWHVWESLEKDPSKRGASQAEAELFHAASGSRPGGKGRMSRNRVMATDDCWHFKLLTDITSEVAVAFFSIANIASGAKVINTKLKRFDSKAAEVQGTCVHLMADMVSLNAMLAFLGGALLWPSSIAAVKVCDTLLKLTSSVNKPPLLPSLVHLFGCNLSRFVTFSQRQSAKGNRDRQLLELLVHLLADLYCLLKGRNEPREMLVATGIAPSAVVELEQRLVEDESKRRLAFKDLLLPARPPDARRIRNLPQYERAPRKRDDRDDGAVFALGALFD